MRVLHHRGSHGPYTDGEPFLVNAREVGHVYLEPTGVVVVMAGYDKKMAEIPVKESVEFISNLVGVRESELFNFPMP